MSLEFVTAKLQSAGVQYENWMDTDLLMHSAAFNSYSETELAVYFGWLKEQRTLVRYLESGKLKEPYRDESGVSKHAQFERYLHLISDLVYPKLKKETREIKDFQHAYWITTFSNNLNIEHQDLIQDEIGFWMNSQREKFNLEISKASSDQTIYNVFVNSLSNDFWSLLNTLNHAHYRIKASWVEEFISIISHKHASARLIKSILGKIETLHLREDHKQEIQKLDLQVRSNKIRFEKRKVSWLRLSVYFFIIAAITIGLTWVISLEAKPYVKQKQEETSFMQLSKAERMEIDSIIKVYNNKGLRTIKQQEDIYFQPPPTQLITVNANNEGLFWKYYRNWIDHEKDPFALQFSTKGNKHKLLPKTQLLDTKKGTYKGSFHNESTKTALVIVFDEMNSDYMYCKFVQPNEHVTFTVNTEVEKLVVVPGGQMSAKLTETGMPFTEFNEYFFHQLERIYTVEDVGEPFKLVYKDMGVNGVVLIDLKQSLKL